MLRSALQLVESAPLVRKTVEVSLEDTGAENAHSLHYAVSFPESFPPEIPSYFISKYSRRGELVLDPFCGAGAAALEAALLGRVPLASDINPLAIRITRAKLEPADLTEVTLALQSLNLRRPIDLKVYNDFFSPFYDVDTFRELFHLREYVHGNDNAAARFLELVGLSLLHGHSAGYFSVYTLPQIALTPDKQKELNNKRHQTPDYRAVVPRLLRRTASILRDGIPSVLRQQVEKGATQCCDARNQAHIPGASVGLLLTAPPLPSDVDTSQDLWLKLWFSGIQSRSFSDQVLVGSSLEQWREFMNEVLFEAARVVRPGGRAAFVLRSVRLDNRVVALDEELSAIVEESLARYWEPECTVIYKEPSAKLKDAQGERDQRKVHQRSRVLVLRRR